MQFRIITESHVIFYSEIRIAIDQMTTELTDTIEYNNSELFIINCQSSLSTHVIGPVGVTLLRSSLLLDLSINKVSQKSLHIRKPWRRQ